MRKNKWIFFILILLITAVIALLAFFIYDFIGPNKPPKDESWNQPEKTPPPDEFGSLYNLTEVPALEKLFVNSTFNRQVTEMKIPYLHGYSSDGLFAAFISYKDEQNGVYVIDIHETSSQEIVYSIYIPNTEQILESKEFNYAKQALNNGYKINVLPVKLYFENGIEYLTTDDTWIFENEDSTENSYLKISKKDEKYRWKLSNNSGMELNSSNVQMFTFPGEPELVTFIINDINAINSRYNPIFINLNDLTVNNSEKGREREVDNWLYGNFQFIYNQWHTNSKKGFIAISMDNEGIDNKRYEDFIEQWVYLDSLGKMKWYGNSKGIFDLEGNPIVSENTSYYYRFNLISGVTQNSIDYFSIDQYDKESNQFLRTYEFKWDEQKQEMSPIQNMHPKAS